ncbi:unnamed protein product [Angiostrongylus costaricensis]|uniref:Transposase n=1 Tax=Angiostrongylus costaricensis TaxID=334426 RepID=A0A0R3PCB0_ANGCS|nr:unnamed protein product [Angiostrongylus costaricensis]
MVPARDKFLGFVTKFLKKNADSGALITRLLTALKTYIERISMYSIIDELTRR